MSDVKMETVISLCKRRGFIFQSSEIYGGLNSCWDYGPYGVELKRNVKQAWWSDIVGRRSNIYGLDASILMAPQVWVASGHVDEFSDPMVDCRECRKRFRGDDINSEACPECGGDLTEPRQFNLMFKTFMGPVEESSAVVFMRPETAQGIFVNFKNVAATTRARVPFGIAQIGKAFRNEITPGNFTFRTREFEQMELEFFVHPQQADEYFESWCKSRFNWYLSLGMKEDMIRMRQHGEDELAHYAKCCSDIEYKFPFGWSELEGISNRTDFDLRRHAEHSGKDLQYRDPITNEKYLPWIIEPSAGADRATLAFLVDSYHEEPDNNGTRALLRLHPDLAPVKTAIFPLMKKPELLERANAITADLSSCFAAEMDVTGSIGKRYRRQDEIGTPFCITVDFDTLNDNSVTVRDRDSMKQTRISEELLVDQIRKMLDDKGSSSQ